jgi:hypothetical protein
LLDGPLAPFLSTPLIVEIGHRNTAQRPAQIGQLLTVKNPNWLLGSGRSPTAACVLLFRL